MNKQEKEKFYTRLADEVMASHKAAANKEIAAKAMECLDLTYLGEDENVQTVRDLCAKAKSNTNHHTTAVCVYPLFVDAAVTALMDTNIKVATVINFPYGHQTNEGEVATPANTAEAVFSAIADGAKEIDLVLDYEGFHAMEEDNARALLRACREACGDKALMKVILETASFRFEHDIVDAALLAIQHGADMLKTSTGKHSEGGATLNTAAAMMYAASISNIGRPIGVKISGGVKTAKDCAEYMALAQSYLGKDFIRADRFRFGASGVYDDLNTMLTGVKPSSDAKPHLAY